MRVTVIAEIGLNHQGNMDRAKQMILAARDAGADIAKFQWYQPEKILGPGSPYMAEAIKAQFNVSQHKELKKFCEDLGIEWGMSIFHEEQIPIMEELGLRRYKVASRMARQKQFIYKLAKTQKPLIISTGLCGQKTLKNIATVMENTKNRDLTLLYCRCVYPSEKESFRFSEMEKLWDYAPKIGFSSHCPDIAPALAAVLRGASVIEQHVVLDKNQKGCDVSSSITFEQLRDLIENVRSIEMTYA